jgi:hypothetical protein
MTRSIHIVAVVFVALATTSLFAQSDAQKAFAQVKTLDGSWNGKTSEGDTVQVSFRDTAGGSAVMSEIMGKEDMISMFHLDGDRLLITHYCAIGNQPRMQAAISPDGKTLTFTYVDATNLSAPDAGHMQSVAIVLIDANHHTEEWTFNDHGREHKAFFDLHRKEM